MSPAAQRYRELAGDLVTASRQHTTATATARSSYVEGMAAIEHDLAAAASAVEAAAVEVTRAQRTIAQTDLEAAALWQDLRGLRRRLGPMPSPADISTMDAKTLLGSAAARIERTRRGGEPLPARVLPLLFLLGACTATLLAAAAALLAWPLLLIAPLSGLPLARHWLDTRYTARLDPGGIGLVLLGGMLATAAIWLTLR